MAKMRLVGAGNPNPVLYLTMSGTMSNAPNIGEDVDLTGLTFTAHYYNGTTENVTSKVLLSRKKWGDTVGTQTLEVGYDNKKVVITTPVVGYLDSIEVKTPPTKTGFKLGETIDTTGMVITEIFEDESEVDITSGFTISPTVMASDTTAITISVTVGDITKTTTQAVTLVSLDSISVKTPPTVTSFAEGADIDFTGLVLEATYTDDSKADITSGYVLSPTVMAEDTTAVTISYTEKGVTKTTTQAVTLAE